MIPKVSIVIPVHNEDETVDGFLDRLFEAVRTPSEVLAVYDTPDDRTVPRLEAYAARESRLRPILNSFGPGPAPAIRSGMEASKADVVVVTMADGSDDPYLIDPLVHLVDRGVVIAAASRYSRGGQQVGGPLVKRTLSRLAGVTLYWFARVGTRDATNSFKAYSRAFLREAGVNSDTGFEVGIELVAKARRLRRPVAELPTIWIDRTAGESNFRVLGWIPSYLRWYFFAFGRRLDREALQRKVGKAAH